MSFPRHSLRLTITLLCMNAVSGTQSPTPSAVDVAIGHSTNNIRVRLDSNEITALSDLSMSCYRPP